MCICTEYLWPSGLRSVHKGNLKTGSSYISLPMNPMPGLWWFQDSTHTLFTGGAFLSVLERLFYVNGFYALTLFFNVILPQISLRMRQVNIVGTSPPSLPSRKIQTLQASPDMFPANMTIRTASQTSLWVRWVVSGNSLTALETVELLKLHCPFFQNWYFSLLELSIEHAKSYLLLDTRCCSIVVPKKSSDSPWTDCQIGNCHLM